MVNPVTVNVGIIIPLTGADVDTWGEDDVNPNMEAIDGMIAGVQTVSVASSPVTLTKPAGFTPTPGAGPTQSQNRVLRFTGTLTANVTVTLPLPGSYIIENLTTGNFVLSFRGVTATQVIGTPQGEIVEIYNDGSNVRFVNLGRVGAMELWSGLSTVPAWVSACTVMPYLICNGTTFSIATYPYLGARYGSSFGGNGTTTFATPDMRGRVPLAYDSSGVRITVAGCGINGQTIGDGGGFEDIELSTTQLPANIPYNDVGHTHAERGDGSGGVGNRIVLALGDASNSPTTGNTTTSATTGITINPGGGGNHNNMQPSIVTGIWVVRAR